MAKFLLSSLPLLFFRRVKQQFPVSLVMGVAAFSFMTVRAVVTKCRLFTGVESLFSRDFLMLENESRKASKILASAARWLKVGGEFKVCDSFSSFASLVVCFGHY